MLHPLLQRGRFLRLVSRDSSGYVIDRKPSAANRTFVNWFSATTLCWAASAKQEWRDVFHGVFERPSLLSSKSVVNQTLPFLINTFENAMQLKKARQEKSKGDSAKVKLNLPEDDGKKLHLSENNGEKFNLSENDELLQVFRRLMNELNVDHAIVLCTKLPAGSLKTGIEMLVKVCLEGDYEATYRNALADKLLGLLKESKSKGCSPSEETCRSLLNWLSDNGDMSKAEEFWQLLQVQQQSNMANDSECQESINVAEVEHTEEKTTRDPRKESDSVVGPAIYTRVKCAKDLSHFLRALGESDISSSTDLAGTFCSLGRFGYQRKCLDIFVCLQRQGLSKENLSGLIDSYVHGLAEVAWRSSANIKRDIEGFKTITRSVKGSTKRSFNMLIALCANHGEIDLCIDLIRIMKSNGMDPCATTYEPLISFYARTLEVSKAADILHMMRIHGLHPTQKAYSHLIFAYTKADNLVKAFNLIEEIPVEELTPDFYTPVIHAYGKKGQVLRALSVFKQMGKKHVKPSAKNFSSLIIACAHRKDLKGAEKVFKVFQKQEDFANEEYKKPVIADMLRVYAACGNNEQIEKMMSCTYTNDLVTVEAKSALLRGFADRGKVKKAIQLYDQIREGGKWPDSRAFLSLLTTVGDAGDFDQLLKLFNFFKKSLQSRNRVYQQELTSLACCGIVHAFFQHNELERALNFLEKIQRDNEGDVETLCLKVFTGDKHDITSVQPAHLALVDKLEFLHAMRDRLNLKPTRLVYESLLESCAREKNAECAGRISEMMMADQLYFNVFTYLLLLQVVVLSGDSESLRTFLSTMRTAVENSGLQDDHVKMVVEKILECAHDDETLDLLSVLYPPSMQDAPL